VVSLLPERDILYEYGISVRNESSKDYSRYFLFCTLLLAIPSNTFAGMIAMSDAELNSVTGAGFSSFTFNTATGVAEADFNILAEGY
jgi:hypothetical protein